MRIRFLRFIPILAVSLWLISLLAAGGCAPKLVSFDQRLFTDADSLFKSGNYSEAKTRFSKISPTSDYGAKSLYNIGFINLYYDNPQADWEQALVEFKKFATMYPTSELLPLVNSWIRILVVLQTFKREHDETVSDLKTLQRKPAPAPVIRQNITDQNYNILLESVSRCYTDKDSLINKIRILEEVIEKIEKKR